MFGFKMERKLIILIIIVLLLAAGGGVFYCLELQEKRPEKVLIREAVKYPTEEEWVIKETPEGKIVENEKAGLKVRVPEGWKAEKTEIGRDEWIVNCFTPDMEVDQNNILKKGCGIGVIVEYNKDDSEYIRGYLNNSEYLQAEGIEVIEVSGHLASKESLGKNPVVGESIAVQVPVENKVYVFDTLLIPNEKERCSQEFEKFLEGVVIK